MSAAGTPAPHRTHIGVLAWIASLFTLKPEKLNVGLGLTIVAIVLVPLLILSAAGHPELWLSFTWGILFTGISDVVVKDIYATRARWSVGFVLVGALLTALGYLLGGTDWALVALAIFVSTLLSYLAGALGSRGTVAGILLNVWFLITLASSFALGKSPAQTWPLVGPQTLAWLVGGVLWMALAWVLWMVQRAQHTDAPAQHATPPGISRPLVAFAALAAIAVALATAVAWGFKLPNAVWMPVATLVALKPSFKSSAYVAGQRVVGALLGAVLAGLLLTVTHNQPILIIILVAVAALGVALHGVNYALYSTCIAMVVLVALGLPHPGNLADNWERVAWTLAGVAISLVITLLFDVASSRTSQQQ